VFFLPDVALVEYSDPWLIPCATRLERTKRGRYRIVYLYEAPDNSTFRYRVYNMIQALDTKAEVSATYFTGEELEAVGDILEKIDVLVVVRFRYSHGLNHVITKARQLGKRVFFDIDDLVFNVDYVQLILNTLDQELHAGAWDHWFAYIGRQGATLKLCDAVITTNQFLADRITDFSGKTVSVIPNFVNREQFGISQALYRAKEANRFARSPQVHVGYFSGTPTHNRDLDLVSGAIARLLERRKEIVLRIAGYMELRGELKDFKSRVEYIPFQDFVNLQRVVAEVEFNLVPLQNNVFTNCKSDLKYFEAGIAGTISIASSVFSYQNSIRDGVNGFLARDFEWDAKLDEALERLDCYSDMADEVYADCEQRHVWYRHADSIAETLLSRSPLIKAD
jgi:glycosyltransferase involved in cell wall biosynthesis